MQNKENKEIVNKENQEIKELYDFFNYISNNEREYIEIRLNKGGDKKAFYLIKEIANKYNLKYSSSGVFTNNKEIFKNIILNYRDKTTMWFGLNPKKLKYNPKTNTKTFSGKDINIKSINFFALDIDRKNTKNKATKQELENLLIFVKKILNFFKDKNFMDFALIFSGNGFQILYKLDEPIILPDLKFDYETKEYIITEEFEKYKVLLKNALGLKLISHFKKTAKKYNAEIDISVFNIGRVLAIPYTYNFKHENKILRKLMYINTDKNIKNKDFSEMLLKELDNYKLPIYNTKKSDKYYNSNIKIDFKFNDKTIFESRLYKFILNTNLDNFAGYRNNYLVFQMKALCNDNNISMKTQFEIKRLFERKLKRNVPWNIDNNIHFNPCVVNNFCILNDIPLLYDALYGNPKIRELNKNIFNYDNYFLYPKNLYENYNIELFNNQTKKQDIIHLCKIIDKVQNPDDYINIIYKFISIYSKKYSESEAKFCLEHYLYNFLVKKI